MYEHRGRRNQRTGLLLTLVAALSLFAASPVAAADYSEIMPADENPCGVDILLEVDFLPTDRAPIGYGDITFTNLETGATYVQRSRYLETWTFDASTESWHATTLGRKWIPLYPGEPGPSGVVQEPGLWILTYGKLEGTLTDNDVLTAFSLKGTYTDLCAELSS
jgi:hypothetical protein